MVSEVNGKDGNSVRSVKMTMSTALQRVGGCVLPVKDTPEMVRCFVARLAPQMTLALGRCDTIHAFRA